MGFEYLLTNFEANEQVLHLSLNYIYNFENSSKHKIKIYYYQKSETENDHFEKTQEISRHFRASMKGKMREKIVPFEKSIPMPQNPKEN